MFGTVGSIVTYAWDGKVDRSDVGSFTKVQDTVRINAGAAVSYTGWVDISRCGYPKVQTIISVYGYTGSVTLQMVLEYGAMEQDKIAVYEEQRERKSFGVDYAPSQEVWVINLDRSRGRYCRIKSIANLSSSQNPND